MSHHPLIWTLEYTYIVCCSCNIYYCFVSYLVRNQLLIRWSGDPKDLQPNKKWWEHPGYASLHKVLFVRIYFDNQSWCGTAKMYKSWLISFKLDLLHQRFSNQDWMKVLAKKKANMYLCPKGSDYSSLHHSRTRLQYIALIGYCLVQIA